MTTTALDQRRSALLNERDAKRRANLAKANEVRLGRHEIKRSLFSEQTSLSDVLSHPYVQTATLSEMLEAQRGWGEKTAIVFLSQLAAQGVMISANRLISELSERQFNALREALARRGT